MKMTQEEQLKCFKKFHNMARKIAWNLNGRCKNNLTEDVQSVATFTLWSEIHNNFPTWNSALGSLSTYLYQRIYFTCLELVTRGNHPKESGGREASKKEISVEECPDSEIKETLVGRIMKELSEEGRMLVAIILESPEELRQGISTKTPELSKQMVKDFLIDVHDWDEYRFMLAWDEVLQVLG